MRTIKFRIFYYSFQCIGMSYKVSSKVDSSGGGGSVSLWFLATLVSMGGLRRLLARKKR